MSEVQETEQSRRIERIEKPQASSSKTRKVYVLGVAFVAVLLLGTSFGMMLSATTPSIPTVIEPGSMVSDAQFTIFLSGSSYYARNGLTGAIDYSSTDATVVIQDAVNALDSSGGKIHLKVGVYDLSSSYLNGSVYYSIGFSSGTTRTIIIEGDGFVAPFNVPPSTAGTILNVTTNMFANLPGGAEYSAIFFMTPIPQTLLKATIILKDLTVRLPNNQRSNSNAIDLRYALQAIVENVVCDIGTDNPFLEQSDPNVRGIILPGSGSGGTGDFQIAKNCEVLGYDIGFHIGDYSLLDSCAARNCMIPFALGTMGGSIIQHITRLTHCIELSCVYGVYLGPYVLPGAYIEILGHDLEMGLTPPFGRISDAFETNPGYAHGIVTYTSVDGNFGGVHYRPFWDAGSGLNFTTTFGGTGTDSCGIVTVTGANKYVDVTHNLVATPTWVLITGNNTGIGWYVVTAKNTNLFSIEFQNAPGTSIWAFYWEAKVL